MKHIIALAALAALVTTADAQPKPRPARSKAVAPGKVANQRGAEPASKKKPVYFDFTGDQIDGDRVRPDGTTIFGLRAARHGSLIQLRGDFLREIVKTGERL